MRILTVCKMNQARSAFAQAIIAKTHPGVDISACGVDAVEGVRYLPEVVDVAHGWGIDMDSGFSRKLSSSVVSEFDLVICAEAHMVQEVLNCGYQGEIFSYEEIIADISFMPKDPAGLQGRLLETELAKVARIHLSGLRKHLKSSQGHPVTAVIPESDGLLGTALDFAVAECARVNGLLVDADLRAPIARELRARKINVQRLKPGNEFAEGNAYSAISESLWPEKSFLDPAWPALIEGYAQDQPVVMITSPQFVPSGPLPDSYLASVPATEVIVMRR